MKNLSIILITLALAACGGGGGGGGGLGGSGEPPSLVAGSTPPVAPPPAVSAVGACTAILYGDSIAMMVAPLLDPAIALTSHAVGGATAQQWLAPVLQDPLDASFTIIAFGTNDANFGSDLVSPVTQMLAWVKARGRTPVLTGIPHETFGTALAVQGAYNVWLKSQGTAYADWPSVEYDGPGDLKDGIHPAPAYAQRLADALSATILGICKK